MIYSKAPIFGASPPGYQERAYDVYTYLGYHLSRLVDINSRVRVVQGRGRRRLSRRLRHARTPTTTRRTLGPDYHPTKWLQFRPEIRYDHATTTTFGLSNDKKNQLSIAAEVLFKF